VFLTEFLLCGVYEPTLVHPFLPEPVIHKVLLSKDSDIPCYSSVKSKILLRAESKHNVGLHLNTTGRNEHFLVTCKSVPILP